MADCATAGQRQQQARCSHVADGHLTAAGIDGADGVRIGVECAAEYGVAFPAATAARCESTSEEHHRHHDSEHDHGTEGARGHRWTDARHVFVGGEQTAIGGQISNIQQRFQVGVAAKITGSVTPTVRKASMDNSSKSAFSFVESDLMKSASDSRE